MKTMNYLFMTLLVFGISCSDQNSIENEELKATNASGSTASESEVSELHLHQHYLEGQLEYLEEQKEQLIYQIENGDESKVALLEEVQQALQDSRELYAFNEELMRGIRLPRLPRPLPNPCGDPQDVLNCPAVHLMGGSLDLLVVDRLRNVNAFLEDTRGRVVSEANSIEAHSQFDGVTVHSMEISVEEGILEVSKQNPVNGEALSYRIHFVRE